MVLIEIIRKVFRVAIAISIVWLLVFKFTSDNVAVASVSVFVFIVFVALYLFRSFLKGRFLVGPESPKLYDVQLWILIFVSAIPSVLCSISGAEIFSALTLLFILVFSAAQSKKIGLHKKELVAALLSESLILGLIIYLMANWGKVILWFQQLLNNLRILFNP
jgi:hypothetical protein